MNLNWSGEEYEMFLASPREHQLVRDAIVEAGYVVGGLPDADWVARLGRTKVEVEDFLKGWGEFFPSRNLSVADLELIRSCFAETLEFFSDEEYQMRMNWTKGESSVAFTGLLDDRRKITIERQWG
ncbi:hypothetical protein GCM10010503_50130 [Streptomyces lucensis JCM 4490]|uniref:Uncharacterized protein n=1 Tax=Streptomyces lucensis JCM 4490 TaxID=1306176 RepID=A0A918JA86_9ACTN|nr:hypothetical protein [Streptomyces lucensis]GGW66830.1 hypothetical protein GCM10010503_50130 [Streptomyces lucensis JCM 4490]